MVKLRMRASRVRTDIRRNGARQSRHNDFHPQGCGERDAGAGRPLHEPFPGDVEEELRELKRALGDRTSLQQQQAGVTRRTDGFDLPAFRHNSFELYRL